MQSLSQQFLTFCRSKPADEPYLFCLAQNCPVTLFGRHAGLIDEGETLYENGALMRFHEPLLDILLDYPKTFGGLADRLERAATPSIGMAREVVGL